LPGPFSLTNAAKIACGLLFGPALPNASASQMSNALRRIQRIVLHTEPTRYG
jgi:hypothetical protein